MYHDARELTEASQLDCDIAVIGAGIAGLALCHRILASLPTSHATTSTTARPLRILLLESGGDDYLRLARQHDPDHFHPNPEPQAALVGNESSFDDFAHQLNRGYANIYDAWGGQRTFDDFLLSSRCRGLGGTGRLWGGKVAELDPIDLAQRQWIEHSGWPFSYEVLKSYLDQACELLGLGHFHSAAPLRADDPRPPLIINQERTISTGLRRFTALAGRANPWRFAQFIDAICHHPQVQCYLHATALRLDSSHSGSIEQVHCRASSGQNFHVKARNYILAAGGLENPRLLLYSRTFWPQSWRSQWQAEGTQDPLGAYFMGHAMHRYANAQGQAIQFTPNPQMGSWSLYLNKDPRHQQGILQLSSRAQRRARLPNFSLTLENPQQILSNEAYLPSHKEGSLTGPYPAYLMLEQRPNPHSRIRLLDKHTNDYDALGLPRIALDWHFQHEDIADLQRATALMATELSRHQAGLLSYQIEPAQVIQQLDSARHHIGTTRMHTHSHSGVVNEHGRVHGIDNLYCAGASVFPTSGIANPTLAIIALSLRLAEHLIQGV